MKAPRNEQEIFNDLEQLCASSGYVHAIAFLCYRDNTFGYNLDDGISEKDMLQQFSPERLVRTEISSLIGLAYKNGLDTVLPSPLTIQEYVDKTESLLEEIHSSMLPRLDENIPQEEAIHKLGEMMESGEMFREAIFYGGESAFHFQYRDLCLQKYAKDNDFFEKTKGYSLVQAYDVLKSLETIQNNQLNGIMESMVTKMPDEWTFLPAFTFNSDDVVQCSKQPKEVVDKVLISFTATSKNTTFTSIDSFNITNAYPLIALGSGEFLMLQYYSLVEAFYETPFFWFLEDSSYKSTALTNRGDFTEEFSAKRLEKVFGKNNVFCNVNIYGSNGNIAGEVDVLVLYANRAIVLQAKSKKLTLSARQGSKEHIDNDFKKAVQDSYDQGFSCAELILDSENYSLKTPEGVTLNTSIDFKEIYIMCIISDHYPSLFSQSTQFLNYQRTNVIQPPYVADVFFLDTLTEMLETPLQLLSFVNRRAIYSKQVHASFELTVLGYHLAKNLWLEEENSFMQLGDDICADLDMAMMTRRGGLDGKKTPDGILTKYAGTPVDKLLKQIEQKENSNAIDFGFLLLALSEDTIEDINKGLKEIAKRSLEDGKTHDITMFFSSPDCGFTIHCNSHDDQKAFSSLEGHCKKRKYACKTNSWHGICVDAKTGALKLGLSLNYDWQQSDLMDELTKDLPTAQKKLNFETRRRVGKKIGRNEKCPCGSNKKYKKCCSS